MPVPVSLAELLNAFEFISISGTFGDKRASISRESGKIYWHGDPDLDALGDLPDDIEDETKYVEVPDKHAFDLGKPLVMAFARECLPEDYDEIRAIFSRRGAYGQFKTLLARRGAIDRWHAFEGDATQRALRAWCAENEFILVD